jgi:hypothetical protein
MSKKFQKINSVWSGEDSSVITGYHVENGPTLTLYENFDVQDKELYCEDVKKREQIVVNEALGTRVSIKSIAMPDLKLVE